MRYFLSQSPPEKRLVLAPQKKPCVSTPASYVGTPACSAGVSSMCPAVVRTTSRLPSLP